MLQRRSLFAGLGIALLPLASARAAWPDRPVRLVMPFAAGGNGDLTVRVAAPIMANRLGQPVVIDNKAGAGGAIGTLEVARARPDGYTLLGATAGPLITAPLVQANIGYDPIRDFAHVALISRVPMVIIVANNIPARTLPELIALSKSRPGSIGIGTSGVGGANHLPLELLNAATQAELLHVPYRGGGAVLPDLVAGNVAGALTELSSCLDLHRTGRARIIAVASRNRSSQLPDVPTVIEAGIADFTAEAFVGVSAPAGTPVPVLASLQQAVADADANSDVRARLEALGAEMATPAQQTPAGFLAYLEAEIAKARRAVALAGLKPE